MGRWPMTRTIVGLILCAGRREVVAHIAPQGIATPIAAIATQ